MPIAEHFPIYNKLTKAEQEMLDQYAVLRKVPQGTLVHGDGSSCIGLLKWTRHDNGKKNVQDNQVISEDTGHE